MKEIIREIQGDPAERTRYQDKLNAGVNEYLKKVWPSYDQKISISLEQERIRVQFFDPSHDDRSYYVMNERSQGCQAFISFLLTIGAEAKHGVISNTVLLLDEPETHLHPSGVRHMLHELIEAGKNGNLVVFATHSIYMIDKTKYDRHIIVSKRHEVTSLQPSKSDRIGYFMQEEVLYGAVDDDFVGALPARSRYNFVFEGDGDALLFESFYSTLLTAGNRPFEINHAVFHHGGGCSNIRKYLKNRPIELGSKWVFILDADKPGDNLRDMICSSYADYISRDVFVFQYFSKDHPDIAELEDLLPLGFLKDVLDDVLEEEVVDDAYPDGLAFGQFLENRLKGKSGANEIKASVKESLNSKIKDLVRENGDGAQIKEQLPTYVKWAEQVIEKIAASQASKD